MPRSLLVALIALVAAPLALLGWVSTRAMRDSQAAAKQQIEYLIKSRLAEIDQSVSQVFNNYQRRIGAALARQPQTIEALKTLKRRDPAVRQGIFVSSDGQIIYPPRPRPDNAPDEVALYAALPGLVSGRPDLVSESKPSSIQGNTGYARSRSQPTLQRASSPRGRTLRTNRNATLNDKKLQQISQLSRLANGKPNIPLTGESFWQVWYMDQGMQLILWFPREDNAAAGVILERPRWASDLTAVCPDTSLSRTEGMPGFTALVDESRQIVYRWGDEGDCAGDPFAQLTMSSPLQNWRWEFHNTEQLIARTSSVPLLLSLAGLAAILMALGVYVLTTVQRQMHAARNRVNFAGQVSHELRTPLTNIRLYAELAEADLEVMPETETREKLQRRLRVIDTESKRLSRLVSGVLEMIRSGGKSRGPRLQSANPNSLIRATLDQFAPSFENAGIQVSKDCDCDREVKIDADIFEMVLVNLLSNVEKYAACGQFVAIAARFAGDELIVTVSDKGPGIRKRFRRTIFKPFSRLDDSIHAPSGTGIGLTIAQKAAKRHGGELVLLPSERGACFELRLPTQPSDNDVRSNESRPTAAP